MNETDRSRRVALQTLFLGAAGAALAGCGGNKEATPAASTTTEPAAGAAPGATAPPAAAPEAAPAAAPAPAGNLPLLDPKDPQAVALAYTADAATVDPKTNPTFKPGQHCANCVQYKGAATDPQAPCGIFAGKAVAGPGWCKVWAPKPA